MVEFLKEVELFLQNNAVLSGLNIGVITTAIGSISLMFANAKKKITQISSNIQSTVTSRIDTVKNESVNIVATLKNELNLLRTQNDVQVKLLSQVIKHAKWNSEAIPELAQTLSEYNELNIATVGKISNQLTDELHDLSKELDKLAAKPPVETESLVNKLFNG